MTFTGTFHFAGAGREARHRRGLHRPGHAPRDGAAERLREGQRARLLGADLVESDFRTAVLRMTDDTFGDASDGKKPGGAAPDAGRAAGGGVRARS